MNVALLTVCLHLTAFDDPARLALVCAENNDLFCCLRDSGVACARYDAWPEALEHVADGGAVLVLADGYPDAPTPVDDAFFAAVREKNLRAYVEYPSGVPGLTLGEPQTTQYERCVVTTEFFAPDLKLMQTLLVSGCRFLPVEAASPHLVAARVAGFDTAVYGLPEQAHPLLFTHGDDMLVATTKLSHFITGRYAPQKAWGAVWGQLLAWLMRTDAPPPLKWTPTVRPAYSADEPLPETAEREAFDRGLQWYAKARMLFNPAWLGDDGLPGHDGAVMAAPPADMPAGDGSHGALEGFSSTIERDGSQPVRWVMRTDCMSETAMALAFGARLGDIAKGESAAKLGDFIYFTSEAAKGVRGDPANPCYGLIGWDINQSLGVFYGDDNARVMLSSLATAALLDVDRWDERLLRCLMANLRTTGALGFRGGRIDAGPLQQNGWRHYFDAETVNCSPHYEAYLWACMLWAYQETGLPLFLERPRNAIRMTMEAYPDAWRWTNGIQQERARLLLPLAWLVRVDDTEQHRAWLRRIAEGMIEDQAPCGAIREELGPEGNGAYAPPASNADYGLNEATLIQQNGDPVADLLYTTNFAFLGLHEATAATGDPYYRAAEDRLAAFLCRIQVRSDAHPELDGAWFRAFDFERWDYWGSNADAGWGAWSIESGWTCGWINAVLAMRAMNTSLWDLTQPVDLSRHLEMTRADMLPDID